MKIIDLLQNKNRGKDNFFKRPYIIAEAGVNHEGNIDTAIKLIKLASDGGADAIKFQTYKAEKLASKNSPSYWDLNSESTTTQYKLFKKYDNFWKKDYELLHTHCQKNNIEFISTPFDEESASFLNDLMPVFKISSSDINNKIFINYICEFSKPIILSTGASNMPEIRQAVTWIKKYNIKLALLHCILNYPTKDINANLGMILDIKDEFENLIIGYSDHTLPKDMSTIVYSTLLGAEIIEKHFTHDKNLAGNDHYHSMDINDLINLRKKLDEIVSIVGSLKKHSISSEKLSRTNARRSLVASKIIKKGERFSYKNITYKRPGIGVSPSNVEKVIGKIALFDINKDDILMPIMIKDY